MIYKVNGWINGTMKLYDRIWSNRWWHPV